MSSYIRICQVNSCYIMLLEVISFYVRLCLFNLFCQLMSDFSGYVT
jgi:hypothetical protein